MPDPTPATSLRFTRAASAERDRLSRKLSRMAERREEHEQAIEEIDRATKALEERVQLLGELAADSAPTPQLRAAGPEGKIVLRGATIREVAVPLLLREAGEGPIHYKHWYELLGKAGYEVLGQRPDAVFLNQVTRSPLVKASTQPGVYSIDLDAVDRLRTALEEQENHLAHADASADDKDFEASAERHRELATSTNRLRRQLDEAERALDAGSPDNRRLAEAA